MDDSFTRRLWVLPLPLMLLSAGCAERLDYAPVRTDDQQAIENNQPMIRDDRRSGGYPRLPARPAPITGGLPDWQPPRARKPVAAKQKRDMQQDFSAGTVKYHVVKEKETLFSIGARSGYGYQKLALWNQISPPYHIETGQKLRLFDPAAATSGAFGQVGNKSRAPVKAERHAKKPTVSTVNEKNPEAKPAANQRKPKKNVINIQKKSIISIDNKNMLMLNFQWPIKGKVQKKFSRTHNKGIDIVGAIGQSVRAAEAGKVVHSGQGPIGFGNYIIIEHINEYLSIYANNSNLLVKEGQQVKKGQVIAQIGVAISKKALLHFQIRKKGKPVNPLSLLPQQ